MKFTLSWLREHLDTDASVADIAHRLTAIGLEIEAVEDRREELAPFVVGRVVEARPHPNADRLSVCTVDTGGATLPVVCGAPNARTGMKAVFAAIGTHIPGSGITLSEKEIRGVTGQGMLCSAYELGLGEDHDGIIELPEDAPVGAAYAPWAGADDPVFEIALTPNRGDCASVRGIARDLAAAGVGTLREPPFAPVSGTYASPVAWTRTLGERGDACPLVAGRYFRNVTNGPSPDWMQRRLRAIGLRPISALVDITNYVTIDRGRPLHVFDADKVTGDLTMRMARAGESLAALDGNTYSLDPDITVIADDDRVCAIGGIMGGEETGCSEDTRNVFLEVALFDPVRTARSGRQLGILSDARYRFERGVDPASAEWGVHEATRLILELCGGEASEIVQAGAMPPPPAPVPFRPGRVASLGGVEVAADRQAAILGGLGFSVEDSAPVWQVTPPVWRPDIDGEADLVEEVLRIHGFDTIPETPVARTGVLPERAAGPAVVQAARVRAALAARGLHETVTFSFVSAELARAFGGGDEALQLANPISPEHDTMRPSILPSLLGAAAANVARGVRDTGLFEVGAAYRDPSPDGEHRAAGCLRFGNAAPRHWAEAVRGADLFDAKADAEAALAAAGAPVARLQPRAEAPAWFHPGHSGVLALGPTVLAVFGELHPRLLRDAGLDLPVAAAEVFLDAVPGSRRKSGNRGALDRSSLMPLTRDFAFLVEAATPATAVVRAAARAVPKLVSRVDVFDVWEGGHLPGGMKSIAIEVVLQPQDQPLDDAAIQRAADAIVAAVAKDAGGRLRGGHA